MASITDFISGCAGGAAGVIIGHPFDTVKVIMQTNTTNSSIFNIVRQSSISSLYKGIKAPLSGLMAINAIVFGVHGSIMRFCPHESVAQSYIWCGLSGMVSGMAQSTITCPMELVKTRAQLTSTPVLNVWRNTIRTEGGIRAVYRGFGLTLARDCPAFATYFVSYEWLLERLRRKTLTPNGIVLGDPSTIALLLAGGSAGALSWLVIYPLDVIKSRLQADLRYGSTKECIMDAIKNEGPKVLVRGWSPTMLRAFPSNAATFAVVSWTLYILENKLKRRETLN